VVALQEPGWAQFLPKGTGVSDSVWGRRHNTMSWIVLVHIPVLYVFWVFMGLEPLHTLAEVAILAALLVIGRFQAIPRVFRATSVSLGLLSSSALLVHFSGGYIEAHFHFFVMLPLVALYQRWLPFGVAVGFVLFHHGVVGVLDPASVYNHPSALAHP